ncbi:MAG: PDZ domain-containing protein [Phycisphaerales bacterium]|nr:PDZ domain-containing protein [Phycisphaerales bacterium]
MRCSTHGTSSGSGRRGWFPTTTNGRTTPTCSGSLRAQRATTAAWCRSARAARAGPVSRPTRPHDLGRTPPPGRRGADLADSSFDAWVKFNRSTPNDINSTVSFYSKGSLVSFLLDMELRRRTGNGVSLDDVLRDLYTAHPLAAGGYTTADLLASLQHLSGSSFEAFFGAFVEGTEPLPVAETVGIAGLELRPAAPKPGSSLGLAVSGGAVRTVRTDGPSFNAGVEVDDQLVSIDGIPFHDSLEDRLGSVAAGTALRLGLTRRGEPRTIEVTTVPNGVERWTLERVRDPTEGQRAVFETWLGQPWPAEAPGHEPTDAAPKPHPVSTPDDP